jgi:hypothetical protein
VRSVRAPRSSRLARHARASPYRACEIAYIQGSSDDRQGGDHANGAYAVDLPPGDYTVKLNTYMRIISGPTKLALGPNTRSKADYLLDNGIRMPAPAEPANT